MKKNNEIIPNNSNAVLIFSDGKIIFGNALGYKGTTFGEICFNTSITGYQEILTDPSYTGQIINFTFPHIGNVGTNDEDMEAKKTHAYGLITRENITSPSNYRQSYHLNEWLIKNKLSGIYNVDTRSITNYVRKNGPQNVAICHFDKASELDIEKIQQELAKVPSLNGMELANKVTTKTQYNWDVKVWDFNNKYQTSNDNKFKIVTLDFGIKLNILRYLKDQECEIINLPATSTIEEILEHKPDGVFLSNGPGDPAATGEYAIDVIKKLLDLQIPIFGICLGHQLLSLALGCKTIKMHQGHRGSNHPVKDLITNKVEITSQNHGFVVDRPSIPEDVNITHISLFDNSIEGISSKKYPAFSVQYHPESSPGPHDSSYLFERFIQLINKNKIQKQENV